MRPRPPPHGIGHEASHKLSPALYLDTPLLSRHCAAVRQAAFRPSAENISILCVQHATVVCGPPISLSVSAMVTAAAVGLFVHLHRSVGCDDS